MLIFRLVITLMAIAMIVVGTVLMISPVPVGVVMILIGILILVIANLHARPVLRWIRERWPWLSRRVTDVQDHTPPVVADPLRETDPGGLG